MEVCEESETCKQITSPETTEWAKYPRGHSYSEFIIRQGIALVIFANNSYRAAARSFEVLTEYDERQTPSFWSIRNWVLRLGLYELQREKTKAEDWTLILDHTICIGTHKALLILGVRLGELKRNGFLLQHQDVQVMGLEIMERSTGEKILKILEETTIKTGVPRAIVSDAGSDIKKAVKLYCENHPQTDWIYDVSHQMAKLLEKEFKSDPNWESFLTQAAQSRSQCQQTQLSYLIPPAQRIKARWMNLKPLINWGLRMIDREEIPADHEEKFEEQFGWLRDYEDSLTEFYLMIIMTEQTCKIVKKQGINKRGVKECEKELLELSSSSRLKGFMQKIMKYLKEELSKVKPGESLLCSSDIIESLFGKYKAMMARSPQKAISALVLAIGTLTSKRTSEEIIEAMETKSMKDVNAWIKEKLGESNWKLRRKVLG